MRKKSLRIVAIAAAIGVVSALSACGGGSADKSASSTDLGSVGAMKGYKADTTFKATEPLTFSLLYSNHPNYPYKADWLLWKKMAELTNVKLTPTIVPMSDYKQKRSLLVGAGMPR